ncbi:MAG TPA: prepilin-type N-terminal cleavage/methylation domain-containing protein [Kiritimatiellia bacterium]|nr:prepilin-type N-terminal cleavage/methylation domain-containing protein [Kiritimatiellia bacterium]HMO98795.1 prepilin-type N-terminal cleavage/methylation domain-containing protein [Kiritimatiellia bacterium]HMP96872.1 prepilin-type N-terminal cleavage/methylation domain-containing protein [Kiritimatiellia bacterium]
MTSRSARSGFTLVEAIVSMAVVAMTVAAAASTVLVARRLEVATDFYRQAARAAEQRYTETLLGVVDEDAPRGGGGFLTWEEETLAPNPTRNDPGWVLYRIRSSDDRRTASFAVRR